MNVLGRVPEHYRWRNKERISLRYGPRDTAKCPLNHVDEVHTRLGVLKQPLRRRGFVGVG
jgi:hypothetical protein